MPLRRIRVPGREDRRVRLLPGTFRARLLCLVILAVLVPLSVLGAVVYQAQEEGLQEVYSRLLDLYAERSAHQVAAWIQEQERVAQALAQGPALVEPCRDLLSLPPSRRPSSAARARLNRVASLVDDGFPFVEEVRFSDPNQARVFFSTLPQSVGQRWIPPSAGGDQAFRGVVAGKPHISNLVPSEIALPAGDPRARTGVPTWFLSVPVRDGDRNLAVLTLRLDTRSLLPELLHQNVYLADFQGVMLTSPPYLESEKGRLFQNRAALEVRLLDPQGRPTQPMRELHALRSASPPSDRAWLTGYPDIRGVQVVGAWAVVRGMPWIAVAETPEAAMLAPLDELMDLTLALMGSIGLTFGLLAWGLSRHLTRPLARLTEAARRLSGGDRTVRCGWERSDEFGQMARTFDQMAQALQTTLNQLEEARDRALDASRAKSRFLANMSHELRTPLNAILGYSEMLIEEAQERSDPTLTDLRNIHLAGFHLLSVINGILDLSRIEAGRMTVTREDFPVADLVEEVQATVLPLIREHDNRLQVEVAEATGSMQQDRLKSRQILLNLLGNALKFTREGTVTLRARAEGPEIRFEVQDTGIGMTAEQCERVFEEFSQADESTARKFGGTGLGLTLVRHFVAMLGGRVELSSEPGKGTTVVVWLPRRAPDAAPDEAPHHARKSTDVLMVTRDPKTSERTARFLELAGFRVVQASPGEEARRLVGLLEPALVLVERDPKDPASRPRDEDLALSRSRLLEFDTPPETPDSLLDLLQQIRAQGLEPAP